MDPKRLLSFVQTGLLVLLAVGHGLFWLLGGPPAHPWLAQSVLFVQVTLVVCWLQLGPGRWFARVPVAVAAIVGLFSLAREGPFPSVMTSLGLYDAGLTAFALAVCQAAGWRLVYIGVEEPAAAQRFSLKTLMVGVLAVALLVRVGQALRARFAPGPPDQVVATLLFAAEFALVALATLWAVLSPGLPLARSVAAAAAIVAVSVAVPYFLHAGNDDVVVFAGWSGLQALFLAGSLAVVRLAGYRWMRRRPVGRAFQPDACPAETSGFSIVHTS